MQHTTVSSRRFSLRFIAILLAVVFIGFSINALTGKREEQPTDLASYISNQMNICQQRDGQKTCYRKLADDLTGKGDTLMIMTTLETASSDRTVLSGCHEISHYIGRAAFGTAGSVSLAFGHCTPACLGGCYHGVVEAFLKNETDEGDVSDGWLLKRIPTICGSDVSFASKREHGECLHGVGHAGMYVTDSDLPRSLALCDGLSNTAERETCYGGVFMENAASSTVTDHPSAYIRPDDPTYPCRILDAQYQKVCYQYQSSLFDELEGGDPRKVMAQCRKVPQEYQGECFRFIGSNQVGRVRDIQELLSVCRESPASNLRRTCTEGALVGTAGRFYGDRDRLYDLCGLAATDDKHSCYTSMGTVFRMWTENEETFRSWCEGIGTESYATWCKEARN